MAPDDDGEQGRRGSGPADSEPAGRPTVTTTKGPAPRVRGDRRVRASAARGSAGRVRAGSAAPTKSRPGREPQSQSRKIITLSVLTVVVVGVAVAAFVMTQGTPGKDAAAPPAGTGTTTTIAPGVAESELTEFRDDEARFSMKYPKSWHRLDPRSDDVRMLVSPNDQDYASVRTQTWDTAVTSKNLGEFKSYFDGIVGGPNVRLLTQESLAINGMVGLHYVYFFTEDESGLGVGHSHYFLFQGNRLYSIVFHALPADNYQNLEGLFQQMLNSFHSDPEPAPPPSETPPAEPTTTVP